MLRLLSRGRWILMDQALSSGSNFLLSFVLVRYLSPHDFGAFGIAFVTFQIVLSFSRALASEPLTIRFSASTEALWRDATRSSTGFALVFGLLTGAGLIGAGLLTSGALSDSLLAFGMAAPALLVQDAWRYAFFAQGSPERAALNDLTWTVVQVALLVAAYSAGGVTVSKAILGWGAAAAAAAIAGCFQASCAPHVRGAVSWMKETKAIGVVLSGDLVARGGATQIAMFAVGAVAGLESVGYVRGGLLLFGPLYALIQGVTPFAVTEFVRLTASEPGRLRGVSSWLSLALAGGGLCLGLLLLALPDGIGRSILAESWEGTREALPAMAVLAIMAGLAVGPAVGLRTLSSVRRLLRVSLLTAPLTMVLPAVGGWYAEAPGAGWGLAAATGFMAAALLWQLRIAIRVDAPTQDQVPLGPGTYLPGISSAE